MDRRKYRYDDSFLEPMTGADVKMMDKEIVEGGSFMENEYLNLPFTQYDTAYLESLPDEIFFARRFKLSEEDEAFLLQNSSVVHGRRFYKAKVKEPVMIRYAAMTNPKEGEPGSKTNPLRRFGKEYVYSNKGDLVLFHGNERVVLSPVPSEEQKQMVRDAANRPIVYEGDCPKSSPERLQRFKKFGEKRKRTNDQYLDVAFRIQER